jgi:beta-lactamase class A
MGARLRDTVDQIAAEAGAEAVAVAYHDAATGTSWSLRGDRWFHAASTFKVAVLVALFAAVEEGRFRLEDRLHVRNRFLDAVDGTAFSIASSRDADGEVHAAIGKLLRIRKLAESMIATSSNLATNLLLDLVGVEAARQTLAGLGVEGVDLVRGVEDEAAHQAEIDNRVTAEGLVGLFRRIEEGRAVSPEASEAMLDVLHKQAFRSGIPAGIPGGVRADARFAHKTGEISTVTHDAGLVYLPDRPPYTLAILTEWAVDAGGRRETVARISQAVYHHLTEVE